MTMPARVDGTAHPLGVGSTGAGPRLPAFAVTP